MMLWCYRRACDNVLKQNIFFLEILKSDIANSRWRFWNFAFCKKKPQMFCAVVSLVTKTKCRKIKVSNEKIILPGSVFLGLHRSKHLSDSALKVAKWLTEEIWRAEGLSWPDVCTRGINRAEVIAVPPSQRYLWWHWQMGPDSSILLPGTPRKGPGKGKVLAWPMSKTTLAVANMSLYKHVLCLQKQVAVWVAPPARLLRLPRDAALQRSFPCGAAPSCSPSSLYRRAHFKIREPAWGKLGSPTGFCDWSQGNIMAWTLLGVHSALAASQVVPAKGTNLPCLLNQVLTFPPERRRPGLLPAVSVRHWSSTIATYLNKITRASGHIDFAGESVQRTTHIPSAAQGPECLHKAPPQLPWDLAWMWY